MKDLILDDVNAFSLEYRFRAGFISSFPTSTTKFKVILNMIGSEISKLDMKFRKAIAAFVFTLKIFNYSRLLPLFFSITLKYRSRGY